MVALEPDLLGPVGLQLARAVEQLPVHHGMPGGARYELKWDGFRDGAVCRSGEVRLWNGNGKDFTAKFPDVQAALVAQVDVDCVLDGELVVWTGDQLNFDAPQQRMVNTAATVRRRLAPEQPASLVVFDVLAVDSVDVRPMRWTARRTRRGRPREGLAAAAATVPGNSRLGRGAGVAGGVQGHRRGGLVVKGAITRYQPGRRDWVEVEDQRHGRGHRRCRDRVAEATGGASGRRVSRPGARSGRPDGDVERQATVIGKLL